MENENSDMTRGSATSQNVANKIIHKKKLKIKIEKSFQHSSSRHKTTRVFLSSNQFDKQNIEVYQIYL
jgi:hypothetical protein